MQYTPQLLISTTLPQIFLPSISQDTLSILGENGCDLLGREDFSSGFVVYPNPGKGEFWIEANQELPGQVRVTSMSGKTHVLPLQVSGKKAFLSLNSFSDGLYTLTFHTSRGLFHHRILLQK